jgi:hypothetical protein
VIEIKKDSVALVHLNLNVVCATAYDFTGRRLPTSTMQGNSFICVPLNSGMWVCTLLREGSKNDIR